MDAVNPVFFWYISKWYISPFLFVNRSVLWSRAAILIIDTAMDSCLLLSPDEQGLACRLFHEKWEILGFCPLSTTCLYQVTSGLSMVIIVGPVHVVGWWRVRGRVQEALSMGPGSPPGLEEAQLLLISWLSLLLSTTYIQHYPNTKECYVGNVVSYAFAFFWLFAMLLLFFLF